MVPNSVGRRRLLQIGGVASATALAGCLGGDDSPSEDTENGSPATVSVDGYTDLLAPNENNETIFTSLQVTEGGLDAAIDPRNTDDPMITTPFGGLNQIIQVSSVLEFAGLSGLVDSQRVDQYETTIDTQVIANGPFALVGDIDREEIRTVLESEDSGQFALTFEQVDTAENHLIFEGSTDEVTQRVAVSTATIIVAELREDINRVIEAVTGTQARTDEEYDTFDWLLPNSGAQLVTGAFAPTESDDGAVPEPGSLDGIHGLVSSLEFESASIAAETSAVFGRDLDETTRAQIEATFGGDAADPAYDYESDRVTISGTYDESTLS